MVKNGLYIDEFGNKFWWENNKRNRLNGPAMEWSDGEKQWIQNDYWHREDGPAIKYFDGGEEWFYEGKRINCFSQEEFERLIKLRLLW